MERVIKFRVWNGSEMIYDVTVGKFGTFYVNPGDKGDGLDPKDSASLSPFNTIYPKESTVMQFTGLLDKNGKEIYENDIVSGLDGSKHEVVFSDGCFVWNRAPIIYDPSEGFERFPTEEWATIIGNRFEHPELLTSNA